MMLKARLLRKFLSVTTLVILISLTMLGCLRVKTKPSGKISLPVQFSLKAISVNRAPRVNGLEDDPVWRKAPATFIPIQGGPKVLMKAVYTRKRIYFLISWPDKTPDNGIKYWEFDGERWHRDRGGDLIALFWNIDHSIKGFDRKGCQVVCHYSKRRKSYVMMIEGKNLSRFKKDAIPAGAKQVGDVWKWAPGMMNIVRTVDDGIFAVDPAFLKWPQTFSEYRLFIRFDEGDSGTKQYFTRNPNAGSDQTGPRPALKLKEGLTIENKPFPNQRDMEKIDDYSIFKPGDKIPLFMFFDLKASYNRRLFPRGRPEGSRLDITGYGRWNKGKWTLEISRKLNTGYSKEDVEFNPQKNDFYVFGIAIFDNVSSEKFSDHKTSPPVALILER